MLDVTGVYSILSTPFVPDGGIDEASLGSLVDANLAAGVNGVTALGVAGEAHRLTDVERRRVIEIVVQRVGGRVPVIVGNSFDGTRPAMESATQARDLGAVGLMVAPPTFLQAGAALTEHLKAIASVGLPIVLQDYPPINGVMISPSTIAQLVNDVPQICCIKLEGVPTPMRLGQTKSKVPAAVRVIGGLGATYLLDELRRGSDGTMTGFAYQEVVVRIVEAWKSGNAADANRDYYRMLPLIVFEGQTGIGLAIRKEILRRRGYIVHGTVRAPGINLDEGTAADLDAVLDLVGTAAKFS